MINIHFLCTKDDIPYLPMLKSVVGGKANVSLNDSVPITISEVYIRAKEKGATKIATTSPQLLRLLLTGRNEGKLPSISNYAGSIIERFGVEFLILDPVQQLVSVTYGKHLYDRFFKKFIKPTEWLPQPKFQWSLFEPNDAFDLLELFSTASFISTDIETGPEELKIITCISFTAIFFDYSSRSYRTSTIVVPFTSEFNVAFVRQILALPVPKIFQNGKYDNAYLLRYNSITVNWAFDTINLFHAWYSELPKDLGLITAYMLRNWVYHKDEARAAKTEMDYFEYNAKDSFTTALDFLALILEYPTWAGKNYIMEFPLVFPCLLAEMTGIACDDDRRKEVKGFLEVRLEEELRSLRKMTGNSFYNPSSPQQTMRLFEILGCGDLNGTGKIPSDKAKSRHPLNKRIIGGIEQYRKNRKSVTSYFKDEAVWCGRIFYALNPHGTDSGRLASKESQFWCGLQIQNITRDNTNKEVKVKEMFVSDQGFLLGESDYSQAETWDTAYLSGDPNLLKVIHDPSKDFHSFNASAFFGLNYNDICRSVFSDEEGVWIHTRLMLDIIDISKRNNHGSNYNMGAGVLLDTMGIANVIKAKQLLKLPFYFTLLQVTQHILDTFVKTYPVIKREWYDKVKADVKNTGFLISPDGWHRFCFADPSKSKLALNSYVSHPPQNLNSRFLNIAWLKVFYEIALANVGRFKLCAQIHDCIFFQYRIGFEHLAWQVKAIMEAVQMPVKDSFGITRILSVPVDLKGDANRWSEMKKMKRLKS